MPNIRISDMALATTPLVGDELVELVQGGFSRQSTVDEVIAAAAAFDATFVTVSANAILPNERILTAGTGINIVDGGAGNAITISFPGNLLPTGSTDFAALRWDDGGSVWIENANLLLQGAAIYITEVAAAQASVATLGQYWVRNDVPNIPMFTQDDGTDIELNALGFVIDQHDYNFITGFGGFDPGAGNVEMNQVDPTLVTTINISDVQSDGTNIDADVLDNIEVNTILRLVDPDDLSVFLTYTVTSNSAFAGHHLVGVNHQSGIVAPGNNDNFTLDIQPAPYFDLSGPMIDGEFMRYSATDDRFTPSNEVRINTGGGVSTFSTSTSVMLITSASRIATNVTLNAVETTVNDAIILSTDAVNYQIGTGVSSAKILQLSSHAGALPVQLHMGSTLSIGERTNALADILSFGQFWVRDDAPNTAMFTDDAGNDFVIGGSLDPLPSVTDDQTLVAVGTVLTASDFFKHDNSDIITLTNQFADAYTITAAGSGSVAFGGDMTNFNIGDANMTIGSVGNAARLLLSYVGTLMSVETNTAAHTLRLGNTGTPWGVVELMQGTPLRWLESGGLNPIDVNNSGTHLVFDLSDAGIRGLQFDGNASLYLDEQPAPNTLTANYGQFWVRNNTPNLPMFTNDTGIDRIIDPGLSEVVIQNSSYQFGFGDEGRTITKTSATVAQVYTIPANATTAFRNGTLLALQNNGSVALTIAITTDTLTSSADGTTGTRTIAAQGSAVMQKTSTTGWKISGDQMT